MSKLIEMKITRKFSDSVEIIGKYSYAEIQSCTLTAIDIIVTTIPFNRAGSKVIFIDVINLDRDLDQLQAAISHSENSSRSEMIQLFDRNHFYYLEHPPAKEELLNTIVGKLVEDKYAPEDFLESILEREELGQTNLNNILAIPHPMSLMAFKSVVPVAVIPNGIDWGDGHLEKFVFLFSITKQDYANTEYIYDLLLKLMDQNRKQEHILSNHYFEYLSNFRHEELKITTIATHITFSNLIKKQKHQWKSMYFSWRIRHY